MLSDFVDNELTGKVIKCFYEVYNNLGPGYLEKVYENALAHEIRELGYRVEQQKPIKVYYKDHIVGDYYADLCVEDSVIIELKCVSALNDAHEAQLLNYLYTTKTKVGFLMNYGSAPECRRRVNLQRNPYVSI